jgi:hypothetical protein
LNAATIGGEVGTGRELLDALARGLTGGSSFGQPINNSGANNTNAAIPPTAVGG